MEKIKTKSKREAKISSFVPLGQTQSKTSGPSKESGRVWLVSCWVLSGLDKKLLNTYTTH